METININNKPYKVRFSLRAIKIYEEIAQKSVTEMTGTWDNMLYFYSTLKALNDDFSLSIDEFEEYISANTDLLFEWQKSAQNDTANLPIDESDSKKKANLFMLWRLSALLLVFLVALPFIFGILSICASFWLIIKPIIWLGKKLTCKSDALEAV